MALVELDEADLSRLAALHDVMEPQFSAIVERFFAAIVTNPGTAAVLSHPDDLETLRPILIEWMSTGLRGPYDDTFCENRSRIGRQHVASGLAQHYVVATLSLLRREYHDCIEGHYQVVEARLVSRAVNRLLDVEAALILRDYQEHSEKRLLDEERNVQANKMLAMQTLTAGLAHEVRNPLNSAKLQLELLERRLRRDVNDARFLEPSQLAHQEIERLTQVLQEFLEFARPPELDIQEHDIVALARHVLEIEQPLATSRGATMTLIAPESVVADVDSSKLHQVIQQLVRNGLEAVSDGGRVTVRLISDPYNVHIQVADDGPGMPDSVRRRIYEPFFSTKDSGTGLGLSIVHSMVKLHRGTIDIESTSEGTRFDVAMPRRPI